MKKIITVAVLAATVASLGCSSTQSGTSIVSMAFKGTEFIPRDQNRICIREIRNMSSREEIPEILLSEMKRRINSGESFHLTDDMDSCNVELKIILLPMKSEPLSFTPAGLPERRRIRLDALVTLVHVRNGREVLKDRGCYADLVYSTSGKGTISEYRAITDLTGRLSEKIISVITTGWFDEERHPAGR